MSAERLSRLQKWIVQYAFKNEVVSRHDVYSNYWACHNWELPYPKAYQEAYGKCYPRATPATTFISTGKGGNRIVILCLSLKNLKKKEILWGYNKFHLTDKGKVIASRLTSDVPVKEAPLDREKWLLDWKRHIEAFPMWYRRLGYDSVFYSDEELTRLIKELKLKLNHEGKLSLRGRRTRR